MIHSLDLMHITKNVYESLLATILNMPEKTKDGPKARNDLKQLGIRKDLQPPSSDDDDRSSSLSSEEEDQETQNSRCRKGKKVKKDEVKLAPACFTCNQEEIKQFIKCLLGVKFPNGYAGKISRWLDGAAALQRDEVSRLCRADDADTSGCHPRDNGQARP